MKYRESGMPNEEVWNTFFNPIDTLVKMGISNVTNGLIDIGCGYGTFFIPAAEVISGPAIGIDIDQGVLNYCQAKIEERSLKNTHLLKGDVSDPILREHVLRLIPKKGVDYISLFNILHCEEPRELLHNCIPLLKPGGNIGVTHWIYADTPRGPSLEIRPKPEDIIRWAKDVGLELVKKVDLPPYHFGLLFHK